jgi:Cleft lip and palate transmembrane protein 1 (CLPTM1)
MNARESWPQYISRLAPFVVGLFLFLLIKGPPSPNDVAKGVGQQGPYITPSSAKQLTSEKKHTHDETVRSIRSSQLGSVLSTDDYVMPVFPTHSEDGKVLDGHVSLVTAKQWPLFVSVYLYMSSKDMGDLSLQELVTSSSFYILKDIPLSWTPYVLEVESQPGHKDDRGISNTYKHSFRLSDLWDMNTAHSFDKASNVYCHALVTQSLSSAHTQSLSEEFPVVNVTVFPRHNSIAGFDTVYQEPIVVLSHKTFPMLVYKPKKRIPKLRNLLNGSFSTDSEEPVQSEDKRENQQAYWKPTLDLSLVLDIPPFPRNQMSVEIAKYLDLTDEGFLKPQLYRNEFWITSKQLVFLNDTLGR